MNLKYIKKIFCIKYRIESYIIMKLNAGRKIKL